MLGLNASLSLAAQALDAQDGAIAVTNNNIANVNTPGYSRQVVSLSAAAQGLGGVGGVSYGGYTSVRDELLQLGVDAKTSQQGSLQAQSSSLSQVQGAFSGTTTGIGAALSGFFSAVSGLSTNPADAAARQTVVTAAGQLANAFNQGATALTAAASEANAQVSATVSQINALTKQIASLNGQIAQQTNAGQPGDALQDQRDELTSQLSQLTGVSRVQTEGQPTLTTADGSPLVEGDQAFALQVSQGADGTAHVLNANGTDVTSKLDGGTLGGAITTRGATVPGLLGQLNGLASQFAAAVNSAQAAGYDAAGAAGQPMFSIVGTNASAGIRVALTDGSGVAASSDGSVGSSGNVSALLAVQTTKLPSGATPTDTYAAVVTGVGSAAAEISANLTATTSSLQQLTSQQSAESGVSIDEETTNLIRYQQAYTAAAHVISTVNDLFAVVMNMGTGA